MLLLWRQEVMCTLALRQRQRLLCLAASSGDAAGLDVACRTAAAALIGMGCFRRQRRSRAHGGL